VVVLNDGETLNPDDLYQWCQDRMAKFMVPRFIHVAPALPFSEVGKVDKEALKTMSGDEWDAEARD
jgi:crotonobetaine/carnitine-CoA ligase